MARLVASEHGLHAYWQPWLSGCHSVLSLLIVELFCVIDKLQVWHSEEGWGQLSVNGRALGIKLTWTHLLRQSYVVEGVF